MAAPVNAGEPVPVDLVGPTGVAVAEPLVLVDPDLPVDVVLLLCALDEIEPVPVEIGRVVVEVIVVEREDLLVVGTEVVELEGLLVVCTEVVELEGLLVVGTEVVELEDLLVVGPEVVELEDLLVVGPEVVELEDLLVVGPEVVELEDLLVLDPEVVETDELDVVLTDEVEDEVGAELEEDGVQLGSVKELLDPPSTMQFLEHAASPAVGDDCQHGA